MVNVMNTIVGMIVTGFLLVGIAHAGSNELKNHPSPYLAMHGNDPVDWRNWDKSVFEQARRENKLVFVSIGYFSCHWCHVMQRESYQNGEIAKYLNQHFIPVKIDRELQPALDARFIEFVERTRGYSGWPLNVFVTPEGYPLVGIVYLPPDNFKKLLVNLQSSWQEDRTGLTSMAKEAANALHVHERSLGLEIEKGVGKRYLQDIIKKAMALADELQGGFGEQNKFPMVPQLMALLDAYEQSKDDKLGDFLKLTLDKMAQRGLRDHLRGGFFRYVVDPNWDIPHFEKMLYDNALLAELYIRAAKVFKDDEYNQVAKSTLDFMIREMSSKEGAMIASLSAIDNKGVEGGYYIWHKTVLKRVLLPKEEQVMRLYWGMQHAPALQDGYHPVLDSSVSEIAQKSGETEKNIKRIILAAMSKLKNEQKKRVLPKDDKKLAAWNGLALSAFSRAYIEYRDEKYKAAADMIQKYITSQLWDGKQLLRARSKGQSLGKASLEDYAYVARGLLQWLSIQPDKQAREMVRKMVSQAWSRFYSEDGWLLSEDMLVGLGAREAIIADGPMPSPSAVLIKASLQLLDQGIKPGWKDLPLYALNRGHSVLSTDPVWYSTHVRALYQYQEK
jgi:uncharacterized protein YyaL (SSP411 family)